MHQQDDDTKSQVGNVGSSGLQGTIGASPAWTSGSLGASQANGATLNWTPPAGQATSSMLNYKFVEKKSVVYVVVIDDHTTLRLEENTVITPREMINIAKFINMINNYLVAALSRIQLVVNWKALIQSLKIEKHFVPGPAADSYDLDTEVLYVFVTSK